MNAPEQKETEPPTRAVGYRAADDDAANAAGAPEHVGKSVAFTLGAVILLAAIVLAVGGVGWTYLSPPPPEAPQTTQPVPAQDEEASAAFARVGQAC